MCKQIIVTLEDGSVVACDIVERGCHHNVTARAVWCSHGGREFVVVRRGVVWRELDRGRSAYRRPSESFPWVTARAGRGG
jgi:hypothetical protein